LYAAEFSVLAVFFLSTGQKGMGCMCMRDSTKYYWWSGFWLVVALVCFSCSGYWACDFYWLTGSFIVGFYCLVMFNIFFLMAGHLQKYHEERWRKDVEGDSK